MSIVNDGDISTTFSETVESYAVALSSYAPLENVVVSRYVTHGDEVSVATLLQVVLSSDISTSRDVTVPVPENENDKVYTPVKLCPAVGPFE